MSRDDAVELLRRFNDTDVDFEPRRTVVEELESHAAATPEAQAVADEHGALTYRELEARATALARALRGRGARPESCVVLCVRASVAYVVGALGAMKAGAAYVPIDPEYPQERIELIIEDTDPVAILVDATTPDAVTAANAGRLVHLDERVEPGGAAPGAAPDPHALAYVVYTSGSTGRPKGVEVEHRSLANLAHAQAHACGTTPGDRLAQTAAPAFDATVMEVWHPLVAGASLHIAPHELRRDPRRLVDWFIEREISISMVPTALVSLLFDRHALYRRLSMRRLMTGGAALFTRPAADASFPLVNMYGPTETTVVATQGIVPPAGDEPPTIGRPLANTRVYVLDAEGSPVGVGESGEIWLGGVQVARGYRGRDDLTGERFLPDPFEPGEDARMYRTGDLGAWTANGEIDFHGRVDDQIAIRGYRIEPAEVETAMTSMPAIVDAVAIAVDHGRRGQQLVGYYTATDPAPAAADVRAHLGGLLPEYMVPTAYLQLDEFPLTPNGKIDRKNLPEPIARRADLDNAYVAPRTAREELVATEFAAVLELDEVGADDDFFAMGGDSLDAVEAATAIAEALGIEEFPVQDLYAHPTVSSLLAALEGGGDEEIDWQAETDPELGDVRPLERPSAGADAGRAVLLTGAGGFLGPHVLAALAAATRSEGGQVLALVRATSQAEGIDQLRAALLAERRDLGADWARVEVVPGDLSQPGFGLDDDAVAELARRVDAIVHNGARVHHLYDYGHLRKTNVGGTREVLRLARLAGDVPVRYVSSISTSLELRDGRLAERANAELEPPFGSGYGESKWVAERMVLAAGEQGIPVQAIRLPRAMTALNSGATSTQDAAVHLLRGCIELGAYPQWSGWEPWAPVDLLGDVLGSDPFDFGIATGIAYPSATIASFTRMFRGAAEYGFALHPVPLADWRDQLDQVSNHNPAIAVAAEFGLTDDAEAHAFGDVPPGRGWSLHPQLPGPASPAVDNEYVWRMLDYLVSVGYLSHPNSPG